MHTLWARTALVPEGWRDGVRVEVGPDGRIAAVAAGAPPEGTRLDILLPAPGNLHSHAFQRAMAGLTEARGPEGRDSFWSWRQLMYRFLERLTPDHVEAIAAFVQMEMLEAGFGAVGEFHYLHHGPDGTPYDDPAEMAGRIVAAARTTGIGLTLLPVAYQAGGCDGRPLGAGQRRFGTDTGSFLALREAAGRHLARLSADAVLGAAPHSLRAVPASALAEIVAAAGDGPVHIHAAEQEAEVQEVVRHLGARPVEWLLGEAGAGPGWCLVHCTQTTAEETRALARSGAVAGLCPITEANLGDGLFDGAAYHAAGGRWGVGSDSNVRISLAEELRTLEYGQRLRDRARAVLATEDRSTGRAMFEAAIAGGALALGRGPAGLVPGAWADLLALDGTAVDLAGLTGDRILDAFLVAGTDAMVREVWSAGRHVVRNGRHVRRAEIETAYRDAVAGLRGAP